MLEIILSKFKFLSNESQGHHKNSHKVTTMKDATSFHRKVQICTLPECCPLVTNYMLLKFHFPKSLPLLSARYSADKANHLNKLFLDIIFRNQCENYDLISSIC